MAKGSETPPREGKPSESRFYAVNPLNLRKRSSPRDENESSGRGKISVPQLVMDAGHAAQQARGIQPTHRPTADELLNHPILRNDGCHNAPETQEAVAPGPEPLYHSEPCHCPDEPSSSRNPDPFRVINPHTSEEESSERSAFNHMVYPTETWGRHSGSHANIPATPWQPLLTTPRRTSVLGTEPRVAVNITQNSNNKPSKVFKVTQAAQEPGDLEGPLARIPRPIEVVHVHTYPMLFFEMGLYSVLLSLLIAQLILWVI
ncbi:hypothetical protein MGYG_04923 [Nannizzia gypsea CBS 118893]|uniref:Uncharacterized protein n=1 Tax=Arthroderma gypseum (strain ATCC MYA-4604 / CBS 118893) TaxID=535722 RepID=E4UXH5_ARTGP|nr:hypothetical protein MGYG_04923 [Nannizzia gypsea CBS 118893]EFR01923.1 hypothetical protein MGYG_04923 [Nannizzia gypsea CBS 118893]